MRPGERLAVHLVTEINAFDLEDDVPLAATMSALTSCILAKLNACPDEQVRARVAITIIQAVLENVNADKAVLRKAVTEAALFDVAGSA